MPPRTKQKSVKTPKITRENYVRPPNHNAPASYPWPQKDQEGQPIRIDDLMLLDFNYEGWEKESSKRYNSLLNIEILPTRFGHADTLLSLGLDTDVFETLHAMGIAPLCYQTHELYPDLVQKVLATAHIGRAVLQAPEATPHELQHDENICFLPDPEFLYADPRATFPDQDMDYVDDITPDEDTAYDLGPLDDDADDATYRRWMVDSQRKNNSLMKRIRRAITGGCFSGQEGRTSAKEHTPQQSHRPG
ncbi:hypothetical protein F2Q68_00038955 [Brassica cretica]|uniref:Uncharacterized protein n=2 Tax=Brassica cretica TaxID=69181 RepID=A0ABQ7ACS2_BRACR|nr:hypothetical protein F2Q68_00038955 [Brassica cretica]KAF3495567.1 hypothetical protein DY000_02052523 [Brassica cretica]